MPDETVRTSCKPPLTKCEEPGTGPAADQHKEIARVNMPQDRGIGSRRAEVPRGLPHSER